jgi:2-methylcitrate dehydratase
MPYTVAVALIHGTVADHHFSEECLRDPTIRALTRRVKVEISAEADRRMPEAMLCTLTLVTVSGARHAATVQYHKGHWKNPMSDSEVEGKFRQLAATVLPSTRTDRLLEALWRPGRCPESRRPDPADDCRRQLKPAQASPVPMWH